MSCFLRLIPLSLILLLNFRSGLGADTPAIQDRARELDQVRQRIQDLQSQLHDARGEKDSQDRALRDAEEQIGRLLQRRRELAAKLRQQRAQLADLERRRSAQQERLDGQRRMLRRQVRAAYAMGRQERLKILLNQQDPAVVSRVMVYYDYFHRARAEQMAKISEVIQSLREIEAQIATDQDRLLELQAQNLEQEQRLEFARSRRERILAGLDQRIRSQDEELRELKQNESRLQRLLTQLQRALPDILADADRHRPFPDLKGKLPWPAAGRLAVAFGAPRKSAKLQWDGVLIAAPEGEEVKAIHYGRVAFADWLRGFGLLVIIDHGDGFMTLYGHNQTLFKETGEWVNPGEVIALVGSSGGRSNSGVYFGIRRNGKPVDPKRWCRRAKGDRVSSRLSNRKTRRGSEVACLVYERTV